MPKIILASTSPRRAEILKLLQIPFEIVTPRYEEENLSELSPYEEALRFSIEKAKSVSQQHPEAIIIGSDTLLEFEGEKIGKPKDVSHAIEILKKLKNSTHDVLTGACVLKVQSQEKESTVEITQIKMRNYCDSEIESYIETGEGTDKAGAYALQGRGRFLIDSLKGDYLAAVGLPLRFIAKSLEKFGVRIPVSVEKIYQEKKFMNWASY